MSEIAREKSGKISKKSVVFFQKIPQKHEKYCHFSQF